MHAAIASSSISPYMWIVQRPEVDVPLCGEGMKARITGGHILPGGLDACVACR